MQDPEIWCMIVKNLAGDATPDQKERFENWHNLHPKNKELYVSIRSVWEGNAVQNELLQNNPSPTFFGRFTKQKIKNFIVNQAIGHLVGFIVGMWVTSTFTHYVVEKRGIKNLFGLVHRRKIEVNDFPEWLQSGIAILLGFITLELINHFFQTGKHLIIWKYLKKMVVKKG